MTDSMQHQENQQSRQQRPRAINVTHDTHDQSIEALSKWLRSSTTSPAGASDSPYQSLEGYIGYPALEDTAEVNTNNAAAVVEISSKKSNSPRQANKLPQISTSPRSVTIPPLVLPTNATTKLAKGQRKSPKRRLLTPRSKEPATIGKRNSTNNMPLNKDPDIVIATTEEMHRIRRANMSAVARGLDTLGTSWNYADRILTVADLMNSKISLAGARACGFLTWNQLIKGGLKLEHLKRGKWLDIYTLVSVYEVTGEHLKRDLNFSIKNVISEKLFPDELHALNITTDTLFSMGMSLPEFLEISFSLRDWVEKLKFDASHLERLGYNYESAVMLIKYRSNWEFSIVKDLYEQYDNKKLISNQPYHPCQSSPIVPANLPPDLKQSFPSPKEPDTRPFSNIYHGGVPSRFNHVESKKEILYIPVNHANQPVLAEGIIKSDRHHLNPESELDLLGASKVIVVPILPKTNQTRPNFSHMQQFPEIDLKFPAQF